MLKRLLIKRNRIFEHRIVFNIEDFVIIRNVVMIRIDNVFLYELSKRRVRLFMKMIMIKNFKEIKFDLIFRMFYQKLFTITNIIELLNIDIKKHYILQINRIKRNDNIKKKFERNKHALLLYCNYDI